MDPQARWLASLLLAPLLGFACFLVPIVFGGTENLTAPGSVNVISRVFEATKPVPTAILLVLAGFGLRYFAGKGTWVLPVLLIVLFPLATVYGVLMKSGQHNLFPFEFASQFVCWVPALLGSFAASMLAKRKQAAPVT